MGDAGVDFDALQIEDDQLRPEHVFTFSRPTAGYMCPLSANVYGIDFLSFRIRDMASGRELFRVARDPSQPAPDLSQIPPGDPMEDAVPPESVVDQAVTAAVRLDRAMTAVARLRMDETNDARRRRRRLDRI